MAVKLRQDFDALFLAQIKLESEDLHHQDANNLVLTIRYKYIRFKTHRAPQSMHQNLAVILQRLYCGKICAIALVRRRRPLVHKIKTTLNLSTLGTDDEHCN